MARNPNWSREELILALDLYFRAEGNQLEPNHPEVIRLSKTLNALPVHSSEKRTNSFRNPDGVSMKLGNFRRFDPDYKGAGLERGGKADQEIWEEFSYNLPKLRNATQLMLDQFASFLKADPELSRDKVDSPTWVEEIAAAIEALGGEAEYIELYGYIEETTSRKLPTSWKEIIRSRIEESSSDSSAYLGKEDLFYSVGGIGNGRWGLRRGDDDQQAGLDELSEEDVLCEGALKRVYVNRYERDRRARKLCLDHFGFVCQICGFSFEEEYEGVRRSVIHVLHRVPLSAISETYIVDPIKDLVPVCANCHAVIHSRSEPLTVEVVKKMLRQ